jgi:Peptidase propeptide and YPEB domain
MRLIPVLIALGFGLAASPAAARYVDIEEVRAMAFDIGIVQLEKIKLHKGVWKVEGDDASGHEIEMKIDAASGRIIKLKRD